MAFIATSIGACGLLVRDTNNQLAESFAIEQADEGLRGIFKTINDVLAELDLPFFEPRAHSGEKFAVTMAAVGNEEALHFDALGVQRARQEP